MLEAEPKTFPLDGAVVAPPNAELAAVPNVDEAAVEEPKTPGVAVAVWPKPVADAPKTLEVVVAVEVPKTLGVVVAKDG